MSTHVPEFEVALAESNFGAIEDIWLNLLEQRPDDVDVFLSLAERLAKKKETRRAAGLLVTCIGPLKEAGHWDDAFRVIRSAAGYHPKEKKLWDELMEVVKQVFADFPEIDRITEDGRDGNEGQVGPFLDYIDRFTTFRPNDYVEHTSGWGVGQVVDVSPSEGKLTVDFINKKGHKFALEAASRMLDRLGPEHFEVWKVYRLDELQALVKDDPLGVVKLALRGSRNRTLTQREIKSRLVPAVMDQKTWSRFLTNIKKKAQKDEFIKVGTGQNPPFQLLAEAVTFDDAALERFNKPGTWEEKLDRGRTILTQINEHNYSPEPCIPPVVAWHRKLVDEDDSANKPSGLGAVLMLDEIGQSFPDQIAEFADALPTVDLYFDAGNPQYFIELISQVPVPRYQREGLARVLDAKPDSWEGLIELALRSDSQPLWEEAARQCEQSGRMTVFESVAEDIGRAPAKHADNFLWLTRQTFVQRKADTDADSILERYKLFEKLLVLATRLNHQHGRGSKAAKASLQKLKTLLSEDRNFMLGSIVKDITPDQAAHLYNHIDNCAALGNTLPPKLRRMLRKYHPSVETPVEAEEGVYYIDPKVVLATRRGLSMQNRRQKQLLDDIADNAKAIGAALEMGDISENAELDAAREKEGHLKRALAEVSESLKNVKLILPEDVETGVVSPGCRVAWTDEETGDREEKTILGPWDSDHTAGIISYLAPVSKSLLGARQGDVVSIAAQGQRRVRIELIENALADSEFNVELPLPKPGEDTSDDDAGAVAANRSRPASD